MNATQAVFTSWSSPIDRWIRKATGRPTEGRVEQVDSSAEGKVADTSCNKAFFCSTLISGACSFLLLATIVVSLLSLSLTAKPALAAGFGTGYDFFASNDLFGNSLGSSVDLSAFGLGVVDLKGDPFPFGGFGPATGIDTIVERLDNVNPFDPPNGVGTIDIELVALSLTSIDPIDLTPLGGPFVGVQADLYTTINKDGLVPGLPQPDLLPPSLGKMEVRHDLGPLPTDDIGGSFDSIFGSPGDTGVPLDLQGLLVPGGGVTADAIFTIPGGDPANPADVLFTTLAPRLTLWSQDSQWRHTPFADFQVTEIEHFCPFPECHPVRPIYVPEPGTAVLLVLGGVMIAYLRRG